MSEALTKCIFCDKETVHKTTVRVGDLINLTTKERILYNTLKKNYYVDFLKCFSCGKSWESSYYK